MSLIQCTDPCVYQLDGRCTPVRDPGPGRMEKAPEEL